jgi:hypothetical protein
MARNSTKDEESVVEAVEPAVELTDPVDLSDLVGTLITAVPELTGQVTVRWSVAWSEYRPGDVTDFEMTPFLRAMIDQGRCELLP